MSSSWTGCFVGALALLVTACAGSASPTTGGSTTPTSTSTSTTIVTTTAAASTTTTTVPAPRTATLVVAGSEEMVFDWSEDRCDAEDIPDLPARAFRDTDGVVHLIASHLEARQALGPTLDDVAHECSVLHSATRDADPAAFADAEWIASPYTTDGTTVYALVHDEYHGWERGDCAGVDAFRCWYNALTLAVSTDGGLTFEHAAQPPAHLVAAIPEEYEEREGAVGIFSPSNIVDGRDGFFYALAKVGEPPAGSQSVCLMRTDELAEAGSWRFWDGSGFVGEFVDPYSGPTDLARHRCPALHPEAIGAQMIESLTWNTILERWVLVGISADSIDGREVWGFFYSFSDDLVTWTPRRLLLEIDLPWTVDSPGSDVSHLYPVLLDPDSASLNFETTDDTAYLYFTRNNAGHASLDRDLVRVPVEFVLDD